MSLKICVSFLFVLFYICVETDSVGFEEFCGLMSFVRNNLEMN